MMPMYRRFRSSMPIACEVSGSPLRLVSPHCVAFCRISCFVYVPVAYCLEQPANDRRPFWIRHHAFAASPAAHFRLLFGTDADVNNRANHGSQINVVILLSRSVTSCFI